MSDPRNPLIEALKPITSRVRTDISAIKVPEGGSRWTTEPITRGALARHLNGGPPRGACPIKAGESVTMLALIDLDSHCGETDWAGMAAAAALVRDALAEFCIPVIPFRSTGGRGIHLYMVWDTPQDAYTVRATLTEALASIGYRNGTAGVHARQAEIFPKQDSVSPTGNGNQFILPLAGQSVPLDPLTFEPQSRDTALTALWPSCPPLTKREPPPKAERTNTTPTELATLKSALDAIPNSGEYELDYDEWRNIIFAIHHETDGSDEGLALAEEFSERASKHSPEHLTERVWPYIRSERDKVITGRSIMSEAAKHGWQEPIADLFDDLGPDPDAVQNAPHSEGGMRFAPIQAALFAVHAPTQWLIKGVLPLADLAVMYGASGSGKSFMALDMVAAIARGVPWRGHKVKQGRVAYVCAEGSGGFRRRLQAYAIKNEIPLEQLDVFVIPAAPNLLKMEDVRDLIAALKASGPWALVVLDTFAQVMPGGNENSGEDVGKALGHCRRLASVLACPVLLVHHSGKDESRGARGWSGLRAAADTEMEVVRADNDRAMSITKQKDGEEGQSYGFRLAVVEMGLDEDDDPITSCVIEHNGSTAASVRKKKKLGSNEKVILDYINSVALDLDAWFPAEVLAVEAAKALPEPEGRDRRTEVMRRAIRELVGAGTLVEEAGRVQLAKYGSEI